MFCVYTHLGQSTQCERIFQIDSEQNVDIVIVPGVVNCFSCALDRVIWLVELDNGDIVQPDSESSPDTVAVNGTRLVLAMPENYVQPGTAGRKYIECVSQLNNSNIEVRLASPSKGRWLVIILSYHYNNNTIMNF